MFYLSKVLAHSPKDFRIIGLYRFTQLKFFPNCLNHVQIVGSYMYFKELYTPTSFKETFQDDVYMALFYIGLIRVKKKDGFAHARIKLKSLVQFKRVDSFLAPDIKLRFSIPFSILFYFITILVK